MRSRDRSTAWLAAVGALVGVAVGAAAGWPVGAFDGKGVGLPVVAVHSQNAAPLPSAVFQDHPPGHTHAVRAPFGWEHASAVGHGQMTQELLSSPGRALNVPDPHGEHWAASASKKLPAAHTHAPLEKTLPVTSQMQLLRSGAEADAPGGQGEQGWLPAADLYAVELHAAHTATLSLSLSPSLSPSLLLLGAIPAAHPHSSCICDEDKEEEEEEDDGDDDDEFTCSYPADARHSHPLASAFTSACAGQARHCDASSPTPPLYVPAGHRTHALASSDPARKCPRLHPHVYPSQVSFA
jgi:hypothetical protein